MSVWMIVWAHDRVTFVAEKDGDNFAYALQGEQTPENLEAARDGAISGLLRKRGELN